MTMGNETILLIEDDIDLLFNNKEYFEKYYYRVLTAETLEAAAKILLKIRVDLILLDINLPDGSGLDFITGIRKKFDIPVIFLTARTDKVGVIEGLTRGGCDYVTKPFDYDVLRARIEIRLRDAKNKIAHKINCGPLSLDIVSSQGYLNGTDMQLTKKEFALLLLFVQNEGKTLTKEYLYEAVWKQPLVGGGNALWRQISTLRTKLDVGDGLILTATRGEGYSLELIDPTPS
jgi:DNA-binding response OmpR family regulator